MKPGAYNSGLIFLESHSLSADCQPKITDQKKYSLLVSDHLVPSYLSPRKAIQVSTDKWVLFHLIPSLCKRHSP